MNSVPAYRTSLNMNTLFLRVDSSSYELPPQSLESGCRVKAQVIDFQPLVSASRSLWLYSYPLYLSVFGRMTLPG